MSRFIMCIIYYNRLLNFLILDIFIYISDNIILLLIGNIINLLCSIFIGVMVTIGKIV